MNNQLAIPNIEKVQVQEMTVTLSAKMELACIPVLIIGRYKVSSNIYYPESVFMLTDLEGYKQADTVDLEEFCEKMEWDYSDTHDLIQAEVENRDGSVF